MGRAGIAAMSALAGVVFTSCLSSIDVGIIAQDGSRGDGGDRGDAGDPGENDDAGVPADGGGDEGCPADMVAVRASAPFCVDVREVIVAEYSAFLEVPWTPDQDGRCRFNGSRMPELSTLLDGALPIRGVDWCDAAAYCAWAGKRLCGRIGGGRLATAQATDPSVSELAVACSNRGERRFPYGAEYDREACNGEAAGPLAPETRARCVSEVGAFDLSGNVEEWVDACEPGQNGSGGEGGGGSGQDPCAAIGGSYRSAADGLSCTSPPTVDRRRSFTPTRGFRCCL